MPYDPDFVKKTLLGKRSRDDGVCDPSTLKKGDLVQINQSYRVTEVLPHKVEIEEVSTKRRKTCDYGVMRDGYRSLQEFGDEKMSTTKMSEAMTGAIGNVVLVRFRKKFDPKHLQIVATSDEFKAANKTKQTKMMKEAAMGQPRTMRCRIDSIDERTGRADVTEFTDDGNDQRRLVDLRSVYELVLSGVRYHN